MSPERTDVRLDHPCLDRACGSVGGSCGRGPEIARVRVDRSDAVGHGGPLPSLPGRPLTVGQRTYDASAAVFDHDAVFRPVTADAGPPDVGFDHHHLSAGEYHGLLS